MAFNTLGSISSISSDSDNDFQPRSVPSKVDEISPQPQLLSTSTESKGSGVATGTGTGTGHKAPVGGGSGVGVGGGSSLAPPSRDASYGGSSESVVSSTAAVSNSTGFRDNDLFNDDGETAAQDGRSVTASAPRSTTVQSDYRNNAEESAEEDSIEVQAARRGASQSRANTDGTRGDALTDSCTEDDASALRPQRGNKEDLLGVSTVWYGTDAGSAVSEMDRRSLGQGTRTAAGSGTRISREDVEGPFSLLLRQARDSRLVKWENIEQLPLSNFELLKNEVVAAELEGVRAAAEGDVAAVLDIAMRLWKVLLQRGEELDRLLAENEELTAQKKACMATIQSLEDKLCANAVLWQNKFKSALDQLDETEKSLQASTKPVKAHPSEQQVVPGDQLSGEKMYEVYLENLQALQNLKSEKAQLKRALIEATAQLSVLTENLQGLEALDQKYQNLQSRHSVLTEKVTQSEREKESLFRELEEAEVKIINMQSVIADQEKKLQELSALLASQQNSASDMPIDQSVGLSLLSELNKDIKPQPTEILPPISETGEPLELKQELATAITIPKEFDKNQDVPILVSRIPRPSLSSNPAVVAVHIADTTKDTTQEDAKKIVRAGDDDVKIDCIGSQVHIHLHSHSHNHNHQHIHDHDHYHNYAANKPTPAPPTPSSGVNFETPTRTPPTRMPVFINTASGTKEAVFALSSSCIGFGKAKEYKARFTDDKKVNVAKSMVELSTKTA